MAQKTDLIIKAKKVVYRGEKFWEILAFSCYDVEELPIKYFETMPVFFKDKDRFVVAYTNGECLEFKVGDLVGAREFARATRTIRFCGHRLHLINDDIKELKKLWVGQETFDVSGDTYVQKPRNKKKNVQQNVHEIEAKSVNNV